MMHSETLWLLLGFAGQALFMMRFLLQWLHSERAGRSVLPLSFWYYSVLGALVLLVYALHRKDPVFVLAQVLGLLVYLRNLYLIHAGPRQGRNFRQAEHEPGPAPGKARPE